MKHEEERRHPDEKQGPERPGTVHAASGGTRSKLGSNYGDWHPDEPPNIRGYDGSTRSGDWPAGDKEAAERKESAEELAAPTSKTKRSNPTRP